MNDSIIGVQGSPWQEGYAPPPSPPPGIYMPLTPPLSRPRSSSPSENCAHATHRWHHEPQNVIQNSLVHLHGSESALNIEIISPRVRYVKIQNLLPSESAPRAAGDDDEHNLWLGAWQFNLNCSDYTHYFHTHVHSGHFCLHASSSFFIHSPSH